MGLLGSPAPIGERDIAVSFRAWLDGYIARAGTPREILGLRFDLYHSWNCYLAIEGSPGFFASSLLWHDLPDLLEDLTGQLPARLEVTGSQKRFVRDVEDMLPYYAQIYIGLVEVLAPSSPLTFVLEGLRSQDREQVAGNIALVSTMLKNRRIDGVCELQCNLLINELGAAFDHIYKRAFWQIAA